MYLTLFIICKHMATIGITVWIFDNHIVLGHSRVLQYFTTTAVNTEYPSRVRLPRHTLSRWLLCNIIWSNHCSPCTPTPLPSGAHSLLVKSIKNILLYTHHLLNISPKNIINIFDIIRKHKFSKFPSVAFFYQHHLIFIWI